jgi:hypothetical protein
MVDAERQRLAYFSHDQARFRGYRWGEDGLAGISDERQLLCLSLALWNGRDPILKERLFGLTNSEGNHGEDVKEYFFYLDATPTSSYLKMLYKYPQAEYPYNDPGRDEPVAGQARSRVRAARHGCSRRRSLFRCRGRIRQSDAGRHPDAGHRPGRQLNLFEVAREIGDRLTGTFAQTADGRRPVHGERDIFHTSPHWRDLLLFYEYFNGDNGSGVGASHQTGWTGTVALLPLLFRGPPASWCERAEAC